MMHNYSYIRSICIINIQCKISMILIITIIRTDGTDEECMKELHNAQDTVAVPDIRTEHNQNSEYDVVSNLKHIYYDCHHD